VDARFTIAAALIVAVALVIRSASSPQPAKSRLKSATPPRQLARPFAERLSSVVAEINAYLLVLAIGLGALDLAGVALANLPDPATISANSPDQTKLAATADPAIITAAEWGF
jgi:hypothetical protein